MEEKKIKKTNKVLLVLIMVISTVVILGFLGLFICVASEVDDGIYTKFDYNITGELVINNKIKITGVEEDKSNDFYHLQGYLENISGKNYEYATVEYSLYDEDNILLDRVSATISDLKDGQKWKFILTYPYNDEVFRYELTEVRVY